MLFNFFNTVQSAVDSSPKQYAEGGGVGNAKFTEYYLVVNLDERGEYSADVLNPKDEIVFSIPSLEEMNSLIEDGFLKYKADEDLNRLTKYLMSLGVIPNNSQIYSEQEYDEKIREYSSGGKILGKVGNITFTRGRGRGVVKDVYLKNEKIPSHYISYTDNIEEIHEGLKSWAEVHKKNFNEIERVHFSSGGGVGKNKQGIVERINHNGWDIKHYVDKDFDIEYWYFNYSGAPFEFKTKGEAIKALDDLIKEKKYAKGGAVYSVIVDRGYDNPKQFKTLSLAKKYVGKNIGKADYEIVDYRGDSIYIHKDATIDDLDFLFS